MRPSRVICMVLTMLMVISPHAHIHAHARAEREPAFVDLKALEKQNAVIEGKIVVTKKEIGRIRDASFLPDLYFALADMYTQKARLLYLIKLARNPGKKPDALDFTAEKRPKLEAIEIYQKIYSFFPKEKRRDKALFLIGLEQRDLGLFEQMIKTFGTLSREFPQSENFAEANIILGDFLFESRKDVAGAIEVFSRVVNRPPSPFTPIAHYRIGWCYVNQSKYDEAVKAYEAAIENQALAEQGAELPEAYRRLDIRREAVVALALPYVEIYADPKKASPDSAPPAEYFMKKSPDHFTYRRVMARAGRRLILKEKWQEAADSFFQVLVLSSDFDTRFEALQRINESHRKTELSLDLLRLNREIGITVDLLQTSLPQPIEFNSEMAKAPKRGASASSNQAMQPVAQLQFLEAMMRDFATLLHRRARATGSPMDFDAAGESYRAYLDRFAKAPKALDMAYNLAEASFKAEHLVRAGMQYERLSKEKRFAKRAAAFQESALESYTKALQASEALSPVDRIRAQHGLREVGQAWANAHLQAPGAPAVLFNIANSWYEERNLKKAIASFQDFISRYPQDQHVRDAIFLIINSFSQLDDFKGLESAGARLAKTVSLTDGDREAIQDAVRRARAKQLQINAGDFGTHEYVENLLSVASKHKGSTLGIQALYEAFNSLKAKRDPELFEVGEALLDLHADSQYAKEVASQMAMLALATASFDRAAKYLSRFANKYPQEKESAEFRKTSAALFERQGDFKRARDKYSEIGDKAAVARMDFALGDWARLESSSQESELPEKKYWHALAVWRLGRYQDAAPLMRALADDRSAPADQIYHARFLLTQMTLARFNSIQMKSAEDEKAMVDKIKTFKDLAVELQSMVKSGVGRWPIAGLYVLGQANFDLGRFIADSPLPKGLSEADKKAYMAELHKQADGYRAEANKVFTNCLLAAQTNEIFTRYVDGCRGLGHKSVREEDDIIHAPHATGGEPPRAKAIRRKLIDDSKNLPLLFELGEAYFSADQPRTAAGVFAHILEIDKDNSRARASIGVALLATGELDAAYESFKKALERDPLNATALWNLAGLYRHFGFTTKLQGLKTKMNGLRPPKMRHPWALDP